VDISAVNPTAMTPWRLEQLWKAYLVAYQELTRELDTDRIREAATDLPEAAGFLQGFPTRYLRTHSAEEIRAHLELDKRSREVGIAVDFKKYDAGYRLTLVTADRPGVFASIAGALSSFGMNILKAEAFANREGRILDSFSFSDPSRTLELNPTEIDRLRVTVERVVLGRVEVKHLLQNRPKPQQLSRQARIAPTVVFDSQASETATLVQIVAEDRPGLLYDLAGTLSGAGCNIEVVLIDTEAHKAVDVFYVTVEGRKLGNEEQDSLRTKLLAVCAA
jgi:[protein-PII] uridylyltransferase